MAIVGLGEDSFQATTILFEKDQQLLYELLIKLKYFYEKGTPVMEVTRSLFFGDNRNYWELVKKMKDYEVNVFNQGGKIALRFVQNVFSVFDDIANKRSINLNDLIIGMKIIYKNQIKQNGDKTDDSSRYAGIFDEVESYD